VDSRNVFLHFGRSINLRETSRLSPWFPGRGFDLLLSCSLGVRLFPRLALPSRLPVMASSTRGGWPEPPALYTGRSKWRT